MRLSIKKIGILMLFFLSFMLQNCGSESAERSHTDSADKKETLKNSVEDTSLLSMQQIADSVDQKLHRKALGFTSDLVPLTETLVLYDEDEQRQIHKQYDWNVAFPVTIRTSDLKAFPKENSDKVVIKVSRLTIGKRFSYGDKKATTIKEINWVDEDKRDDALWSKLDQVSLDKIQKRILTDKTFKNQLKNKAASVIISKINELTPDTRIADNAFEITIGEIVLK